MDELSVETIEELNGRRSIVPSVKYNGGFEESEDEYDYLRMKVVKGVIIA